MSSRSERGQSLVEVIAMVPIVMICASLGLQALAAGTVHIYADNAAHAGALAAELGQNPLTAARDALPGWAKSRIGVTDRRNRVSVAVEPRALVPALSRLLTARASAAYVR